jgi:hypothetical protein
MAALRMAFKAWLDGEPEELNSDRPSEEQMHQYEQAEKEHQALVSRMIRDKCLNGVGNKISAHSCRSFMQPSTWRRVFRCHLALVR